MRVFQCFSQKRSLYFSVSLIAAFGLSAMANAELKINPYPQAAAPVQSSPAPVFSDLEPADLISPEGLTPQEQVPVVIDLTKPEPQAIVTPVVELPVEPETVSWRAPRAKPAPAMPSPQMQDEFDREFEEIRARVEGVEAEPVHPLSYAPPPPTPDFTADAFAKYKPQPGRYASKADYLARHGHEQVAASAPSYAPAPVAHTPSASSLHATPPSFASALPPVSLVDLKSPEPSVAAPQKPYVMADQAPLYASTRPRSDTPRRYTAPGSLKIDEPILGAAPMPVAAIAPEPVGAQAPMQVASVAMPVVQPLPVETLVREVRPYELPVTSNAPAPSWDGFAGANLRETLEVWTQRAGVDLIWASYDSAYSVRTSLSEAASFEQAVASLLGQYDDAQMRPVGSLYQDPDSGVRTLVVEILEDS